MTLGNDIDQLPGGTESLLQTCIFTQTVMLASGLLIRGILPFTLEHFVAELVEPFFYRLAYVDLYGLPAARADLWPELSHGEAGLREHRLDVRRGLSGQTVADLSGGTFQLSREHNLRPD